MRSYAGLLVLIFCMINFIISELSQAQSRLGAGIRVENYRQIGGGGSHEAQVDLHADFYLNGIVLAVQSYYSYSWYRDIGDGNGFKLWDGPGIDSVVTPDGCNPAAPPCLSTYTIHVVISGYNNDPTQSAQSPDVTIDFVRQTLPPAENLAVDQKRGDNITSYGQISRVENSAFVSYNAPMTFSYAGAVATAEILRAFQGLASNPSEKFNNWDATSDVLNPETFSVNTGTNTHITYMHSVYDAALQAVLLDAASAVGNVEFKDPWFIDDADAFGSKDRGSSNAIWHQRSSPFYPLSQFGYNGIFLDQGDINNLQPPYYSIRALQTQAFTCNGQNINGGFVNWSKTNSDISSPYNLTNGYYVTPVIFRAGTSRLVTANYKALLASSVAGAFSSNSQRKLVKDNSNTLTMVYESGGTPWFTSSTNGGTTWSNEGPLDAISDANNTYRSPCVFLDPNSGGAGVIYEKVETSTSVHHILWAVITGGVSVPMGEIAEFTAPVNQLATPVAAANSNPNYVFVAWRDASVLMYGFSDGYNWTTGQVPSSTASSRNPVVAADMQTGGGTQRPYRVYVAWEEPGTSGGVIYERGELTSATIPATITWVGGTSPAFNSATETNSTPTLVRDGSSNSCFAWVYTNNGQSSIKFVKVDAGNNLVGAQTFTPCSGTASSPSLSDYRFNSSKLSDLTLLWSSSTNGVAAAQYTSSNWSSPYIVDQSGQQPSILITNSSTDNGRSAAYTVQGNPLYAVKALSIGSPQPPPASSLASPSDGYIGSSVSTTLY